MNICPVCYNGIPDLALACPVCQRAKYLKSLESVEIDVVAQMLAGKLSTVRLLRVGRGVYHIGYVSSLEPYCQVKLRSPRSSLIDIAHWPPANLCPNCKSTFKEFKQRAGTAQVK